MNDLQAAQSIQRWFRGRRLVDFKAHDLSSLAKAMRYHQEFARPPLLNDAKDYDAVKKYAIQLHTMKHEFTAAVGMYEAALKLRPRDPQLLACFAVLLAYCCRYPKKVTWQRSLQLVRDARGLSPSLDESLEEIEENCFRWAVVRDPSNAHALGNYAVFLQLCGKNSIKRRCCTVVGLAWRLRTRCFWRIIFVCSRSDVQKDCMALQVLRESPFGDRSQSR